MRQNPFRLATAMAWLVFVALALPLPGGRTASAEEGGTGHYVPGISATLIDRRPYDPGLILEVLALHYDGEVRPSFDVPLSGAPTPGIDARADSVTLAAFYTFGKRVFGGFYTLGIYVPVIDTEVTATVPTPAGPIAFTEAMTGLGDITIVPAALAWEVRPFRFGLALPIYAPTGNYDKDRLANTGLNYWTLDPTVSVSYSSPTTGFNAALFGGLTINSTNRETDYRSGSLLHVEASVQQFVPLGRGFLGFGANAFYLQQITDDSGGGATLGGFRGRSIGIGPVIDYVLPFGDARAAVELRWLPEIETKNRVEGDYFWFKGVVQF